MRNQAGRKFLYKDPERLEACAWSVETEKWSGNTNVNLEVELTGRYGKNFSLEIYRHSGDKHSVSSLLEPVNALIFALSDAAAAFAKACNTAPEKQEANKTKVLKDAIKKPKS